VDDLVIDLARETYDRFVMGGWEPQDAHEMIRAMLNEYNGARLERGAVADSGASARPCGKSLGTVAGKEVFCNIQRGHMTECEHRPVDRTEGE
jgi:hypothetical protein